MHLYSARHLKRAILVLSGANVLAWYEFSLYVIFSGILSHEFFAPSTSTIAATNVFLIFAIGFTSRPLGTLFFSHMGDKIGRRAALLFSVLLMTLPTFGIGLIPSYTTIGYAAPILLGTFRLIQGFATGGEFAGSMTYLYEITPIAQRGLTGSLTFTASQLGTALCTIEFLFLNQFASRDDLDTWGWRISFILAAVLGLASWFLRRTLHETPLFETIASEGRASKQPIRESFANHKLGMLKNFGLSAFPAAGWYISYIFAPVYLSEFVGMSYTRQLVVSALLVFFSALLMPVFGTLADLGNRKILFYCSSAGAFICAFPLYLAAIYLSEPYFLVLQVLMTLFLTIQFALLPSQMCAQFPLRVRYTCVGVSYNFAIFLFGGIAPLVAFLMTSTTSHILVPAFILVLAAAISLVSFWSIQKHRLA